MQILCVQGLRIRNDMDSRTDTLREFLDLRVSSYITLLENILGQRDCTFQFMGVFPSDSDAPHIYFNKSYDPNGCPVYLMIGKSAWQDMLDGYSEAEGYSGLRKYQCCGIWQAAHETVHLMDPRQKDGTSILEEGLATWFQDEYDCNDKMLSSYRKCYTNEGDNYATARNLIISCGPEKLCRAVKNLRRDGTKIGDISASDLQCHLKDADRELLEHLCSEFVYLS